MNEFVISSGHSKVIRGASGYIDEVDEARMVVPKVAEYLKELDCKVHTFNDDTLKTQRDNIKTIVKYHNGKSRDLDVSVHFNAGTKEVGGTEVLYYGDGNKALAKSVEGYFRSTWN
ncbi:N-acetylmuramoyl-L-alanine amidase [Peribacillus sp. JNUCC41]|uniref:N-acetylmuramoyl-L-alanine amidase n=1 Tax=Peribacillus sp. JNUCC41 TaxID=2778370 RepID=UPI00177C3933|nr:N-acetylmuramoyl-L-alanine amidase [Brevibacillus sp. JNUCC-41]QOS89241.1 N-acetylmuramoyl-L-alanine amidase [Brevibacillus sp. JNUCC-41]